MFEKVLQPGETIMFQEECAYCGDGGMAVVNNGYAVLTDKRFFVCKKKATALEIILAIIIFACVYLGVLFSTGYMMGAIPGGILGGVSYAVAVIIGKSITGKNTKPVENTEFSFTREDIAGLEDGKRGVRKMLVIKTRSGALCKIQSKGKEKWISALRS